MWEVNLMLQAAAKTTRPRNTRKGSHEPEKEPQALVLE